MVHEEREEEVMRWSPNITPSAVLPLLGDNHFNTINSCYFCLPCPVFSQGTVDENQLASTAVTLCVKDSTYHLGAVSVGSVGVTVG